MAQPIATITVELGDRVHTLQMHKVDFVRAERQMQKPVVKMDTLADIYELAWCKLRHLKVEGIPDTFDGFLDLEPDVDADFDESDAAGGKASESEASTG